MSEEENTPRTDRGISRRSVIRTSATAAAVGGLGITGFTGTVSATQFCPRSPGYWANHWHDHLSDPQTMVPAGSLSKAEIQSLLSAPTRGDKVNIMARQYIATYLNLWLRPDGGEDRVDDVTCANKVVQVEGIGMVEWEHVKNAAQKWLRMNGWDGTLHTGKRTWEPTVSVEGAQGEVDGEVIKDALDAFNNNQFEQLSCNCGGVERSDEEEDRDEKGKPEKTGRASRPGRNALSRHSI